MIGFAVEAGGLFSLLSKLLISLVTWGLVVLGWMIVSDQTQSREIIKNYYSDLVRLRADLSKIEQAAVAHHTGEFDSKLVRQIVRDISNLGVEISQLAKRKCIGLGANDYVAHLRRAITGINFDRSTFARQDLTSEVILNIEVAKDSFDRLLLESIDMVIYRRRSLWASAKAAFGR